MMQRQVSGVLERVPGSFKCSQVLLRQAGGLRDIMNYLAIKVRVSNQADFSSSGEYYVYMELLVGFLRNTLQQTNRLVGVLGGGITVTLEIDGIYLELHALKANMGTLLNTLFWHL